MVEKNETAAGVDAELAQAREFTAEDAKIHAAREDNRFVGRVDPFDELRNDAGQLTPEDGTVPDPVADPVHYASGGDPATGMVAPMAKPNAAVNGPEDGTVQGQSKRQVGNPDPGSASDSATKQTSGPSGKDSKSS